MRKQHFCVLHYSFVSSSNIRLSLFITVADESFFYCFERLIFLYSISSYGAFNQRYVRRIQTSFWGDLKPKPCYMSNKSRLLWNLRITVKVSLCLSVQADYNRRIEVSRQSIGHVVSGS